MHVLIFSVSNTCHEMLTLSCAEHILEPRTQLEKFEYACRNNSTGFPS